MTKDDIGHALGYGAEKIGEAAVLSKGAGAVAKVAEGLKPRLYQVLEVMQKLQDFHTPRLIQTSSKILEMQRVCHREAPAEPTTQVDLCWKELLKLKIY